MHDTDNEGSLNQIKQLINEHIKIKLKDEFKIRFNNELLEVMDTLKVFNAGDENFLNFQLLEKFVNHFSCVEINKAVLQLEVTRAKEDYELGLPMTQNHYKT